MVVLVISYRMATLEETLSTMTDPKEIKRKQDNCKGNLSKLADHFHSIEDVDQDIIDLAKRMEAVEESITSYNIIHQRLLDIIQESAVAAKEAEVIGQHKQNNDLLIAYRTLLGACHAWAAGEHLKDDGQDLMALSNLAGTYSRQTYDQLAYDFKEFRQTIKKFSKYKDLLKLKEKLGLMIANVWTRRSAEQSA